MVYRTRTQRIGYKHRFNKLSQNEFQAVKHIFTHQIRLSPLDMNKKINIATDGANSAGIGFVVFQNANDLEEGKDVKTSPGGQ